MLGISASPFKFFKGRLIFFTFFTHLSGQISDLISILIWTTPIREPFNYLDRGHEPFIKSNCTFQNCFLTDNRSFFIDVTYFDAILFNAADLFLNNSHDLPMYRTDMQEYVLIGLESAGNSPLSSKYNSFFNITWTYKLNSDVAFPYVVVRNSVGEVIGPKKKMNWKYDFNNVEPLATVVDKLSSKKVAAAIFLRNCRAMNGGRLYFIHALQRELSRLEQDLHIFGDCGYMRCASDEECHTRVQLDYYFYLAFENSYCDDYVSEKVLHGLQHYAVPVVLGGADYSRFMPDGIYLNAVVGPPEIAKQMVDIIQNPSRYYDFFKWHGYYSFNHIKENGFGNTICEFCTLLNNQTRREQHAFYKNITKWWNPHQEPIIQEFLLDSDNPDEELPVDDESFIGKIVNSFYKLFSGNR